jgi:hypothetical protein
VHEQSHGDGVFDQHKIVLSGLNMANAALHGHGGIWVMNTPYLMFYPGADGDDNDACGGPFTGTLNGVLAGLHDPDIDRILARVSEWKDLPVRHGVIVPMLDAAQSYCDRHP